ncbi:MAG: Oxidoreductase domain protein [Candidatus Daviesbacteria bacterium GW2011_GWF2_38_7]|nr:MAG: Oxidoreductase domain protein [Candidatus Daviesbacteria bacterium GW2011_GWF2_38_7]
MGYKLPRLLSRGFLDSKFTSASHLMPRKTVSLLRLHPRTKSAYVWRSGYRVITLALIGTGKWGRNYLHTAKNIKDIEIKYICSQTQKSLDSLPNSYIKTLTINDLLKNKDIDGFIIATPISTHFDIAKKLLALNHNLLIEKPLTANYDRALQLQRIWKITKPKVLTGHLYLYNPAYRRVKTLFKKIKSVKSINFEGVCSPIRKDASVIWDWGPHPVSIILDLVKSQIIKVKAIGSINQSRNNLYDTVKFKMLFANNLEAVINISWFGTHKIRKLTIEGTDEKIEFDDTNISNQKITYYKLNQPPQYPKYEKGAALTAQLLEFVMAIRGLQKITSDMNTGVLIVKVLSAIEKSVLGGGAWIGLDTAS